jgi:hypothetical protein
VSFVNAGAVKAIIFLVGGKSIFGLSSIFIFRVIKFSVKKIPAGIYCVILNSVKISTWKAMIYVRALRTVFWSLIVRFIWHSIREIVHINVKHFRVSWQPAHGIYYFYYDQKTELPLHVYRKSLCNVECEQHISKTLTVDEKVKLWQCVCYWDFNIFLHSACLCLYTKYGSVGFSISCFWRQYITFITNHFSNLSIVQLLRVKAANARFQRQTPFEFNQCFQRRLQDFFYLFWKQNYYYTYPVGGSWLIFILIDFESS